MTNWKKWMRGTLAVAAVSAFSAQALVTEGKKVQSLEPEAVPGEYVVQLRVSGLSTLSDSIGVLAQKGLMLKEVINPKENLVLVKAKNAPMLSLNSEASRSLIKNVSSLSQVEIIEPNFIYRAFDLPANLPNDPRFEELWGMRNVGQADSSGRAGVVGADIQAPEAWAINTGSQDVVVAVIDTGVDYTHPDLAANMWQGQDSEGNVIYGYNAINDQLDPMDDHSHGTHCAGTIAGVGNNGIGVTGVAWNAKIQGVKFLSGSGGGTLADAIKAIDWAADNGAQIMSNSWGGGGFSETLYESIQRTQEKGIIFIAAAGNDGSDTDARAAYPASYDLDNIVSVAAGNNINALASFSNYGRETVDLMAPGRNILSTVPQSKVGSGAEPYKVYSGTSMACPHVSGAAALLWSAEPSLTAAQVKERLMSSTDKSRSFRDKLASMGILNVYNLLANITPPGPVIPPDSSWSSLVPFEFSTPHPYEDNMNVEFEIEQPGVRYLRLTFAKFDLESGYDFVKIYNRDGQLLESLSGRKADGWTTNEIESDYVKVVFTTDRSVTKYGFDLAGYQWTNFDGQSEEVMVQAR